MSINSNGFNKQDKASGTNDPARRIQDYLVFGEFGGVNPSITDSATYTFLTSNKMEELFEKETEGCFLYSRHWNPINKYLSDALALLENTEAAQVTASGMSAITCTILQLCSAGDEIISSDTVYGGTYALLKNFLPRFGIKVHFVKTTNLENIKAKVNSKTKIIYCESISNPLMEVADFDGISKIAKENDIKFVVDNTFSPMIFNPANHGADVVVHSMTKFVNGNGDCIAGAICSTKEFINQLMDVNSGASMLTGPVLDSFRSSSILKNLHTLHLRIKQHSSNALYLAERLEKLGLTVHYPGLKSNASHELAKKYMLGTDDNAQKSGLGFGGMMAVDVGDTEKAKALMETMQNEHVGYLAVSLGYFKTLFSQPSSSTSSEIPVEVQKDMGLTSALIRFSIGLDSNIEETFKRIEASLIKHKIIKEKTLV